jgi:cell division protein FtsN
MPSFERGAYEPSEEVRVFDASVDDEQEEEGSRLPLLIVIGLLVFAAFAGVVWLAYTQGVQKGREDAPRMIVADQGPVKTAPANPGGTKNLYTGLKIYQSPAPPDDVNDDASGPQPPSPAGTNQANAAPATSPSLAPVIRPAPSDTSSKVAATPPTTSGPVATAPQTPPAAKPQAAKPVVVASAPPATYSPPATSDTRVATKPPTKLAAATPPASTEAATPPPQTAQAAIRAMPPAAKPTVAATGAFVLQIGAYKSEDEANAAWKSYQSKHPLVGGYESDIKKVDLGDKGTWYRLRIKSFSDKTEAGNFCAKLKADGGDCIPSKQ